MISFEDYFGEWLNHKDATDERKVNAVRLLSCVDGLERLAVADGVAFPVNPVTGSGVSGRDYGGFRPQSCPVGTPHSAHKEALAVDRYDPDGAIDEWCLSNVDKLEQCGIYLEHPNSTKGWSHWTIRPPASGHTVFYP